MASEIVCMSLGSVPPGEQRSRFLAVGLADQTVRIISLDPKVRAYMSLIFCVYLVSQYCSLTGHPAASEYAGFACGPGEPVHSGDGRGRGQGRLISQYWSSKWCTAAHSIRFSNWGPFRYSHSVSCSVSNAHTWLSCTLL